MRLAVLLIALLLTPCFASLASTTIAVTLNYSYVDEEVKELSNVVQVGGVVYAAGSKGNYVFIAAYRGGDRLWATTVNVGGNASILGLNLEGGALGLVAYSRSYNITRIHKFIVGLDGAIVARQDYIINPRLFPLTSVTMGDSIYIAGASFILGDNLNYMVARVSAKGVEWVREERGEVGGGPGDDVLKCIGLTLGSRILVAGDNGTSISIMILSQTGDILRNYVMPYRNMTVTINGCLKISDSTFILYGALGSRPLLIPLTIKPDLDVTASLLVVGDLVGVVTSTVGREDLVVPYVTNINQSLILIYKFNGSQLELLKAINMTEVARGFIALSGTLVNSNLALVGYTGYGKTGASVISLTIIVEEREARLSRIPFLDIIGDPRLTLTLLTVVVSLTAYIAYRRVRRREPRG